MKTAVRQKHPEHLRSIFHKWLLILVTAAYAVSFVSVYLVQKAHAERYAAWSLSNELKYISSQLAVNTEHRTMLEQAGGEDLLSKAHALAEIISSNRSFLSDRRMQERTRSELGLTAFYISDKNGLTVCSSPSRYEGVFNFNTYSTTRQYMKMITDRSCTIVENPRPVDEDLAKNDTVVYQQFAGVARLDEPGIVQVAYSDEQYSSLFQAVSVEHLCDGYHVGKTGFVVLIRGSDVISATEPEMKNIYAATLLGGDEGTAYEIFCNGKKCLASRKSAGDMNIAAVVPYDEIYESMHSLIIWTGIFFSVLFGLVFFMVSNLLDRVVVRNISRTNESLKKITQGHLDEYVQSGSNEEFESLSNGINTTVAALKKAISEAAARIDKELEFAQAIQTSALPRLSAMFKENSSFDLYADMHPAKEVGGDFYDFFMIDDHRLVVVIADVSGKGIPAAMFMMTAKAQIRNHIENSETLAAACTAINKALCEGNDAQMFVTVFVAMLDLQTGVLTYVNGGHNPPLVSDGGTFRWIREKSGLFMGSFDTVRYREYSLQMKPEDTLLLYTDGVTEAMNPAAELYGEERFMRFLSCHALESPQTLVRSVYSELHDYAETAPQADDITMVALTYRPSLKAGDTHIFHASIYELENVQHFISEPLEKRNCPEEQRKQLAVAVEELFVNIAKYAYADQGGKGDAVVSWKCGENEISVTLSDSGMPFNPLEKADPVASSDIDQVKIGGLGILMAKKDTDSMSYRFEYGHNILTFTKKWQTSSGQPRV